MNFGSLQDCLRQLENVPSEFCKVGVKKWKRDSRNKNWTKWSIFFELLYWHKLLLRHKIYVMHVEKKNICNNLLGTLLDITVKTKDIEKARLDLQDMKIWWELHLIETNSRCSKPPAAYVLTRAERRIFCHFLKSVQFSDGFASNLSRNVIEEQRRIYGLKSQLSYFATTHTSNCNSSVSYKANMRHIARIGTIFLETYCTDIESQRFTCIWRRNCPNFM